MINIQPIQKLRRDDGLYLHVHSIFYTIQGEGIFAGRPAVFIRLAGCNLQCPLCDTEYTENAVVKPLANIIFELTNLIPKNIRPIIVITGGEPFRQNLTPLVTALLALYMVQIETNGTLPPSPNFPIGAVVICSPKTGKVNLELQRHIDAYKYVVSWDSLSKEDGLPLTALGHTASPQLARPHVSFIGSVFLQPCDMQEEQLNKLNMDAAVNSCLNYGYTMQLQMHKLIGVA